MSTIINQGAGMPDLAKITFAYHMARTEKQLSVKDAVALFQDKGVSLSNLIDTFEASIVQKEEEPEKSYLKELREYQRELEK